MRRRLKRANCRRKSMKQRAHAPCSKSRWIPARPNRPSAWSNRRLTRIKSPACRRNWTRRRAISRNCRRSRRKSPVHRVVRLHDRLCLDGMRVATGVERSAAGPFVSGDFPDVDAEDRLLTLAVTPPQGRRSCGFAGGAGPLRRAYRATRARSPEQVPGERCALPAKGRWHHCGRDSRWRSAHSSTNRSGCPAPGWRRLPRRCPIPQDDAAIIFAPGDRLCHRADEIGVIARGVGIGAEIAYGMAGGEQG